MHGFVGLIATVVVILAGVFAFAGFFYSLGDPNDGPWGLLIVPAMWAALPVIAATLGWLALYSLNHVFK